MTDPTYNWYSIVIQGIGLAGILLTLLVYLLQLLAMQGQLTAARNASRVQRLLDIHKFMLEEDFRADREKVITFAQMPDEEREKFASSMEERIERVCAKLNFLGLLVTSEAMPLEDLADFERIFILCHKAAEPLLKKVRQERGSRHWHHFTDIAEQFKKRREDAQGRT